MVVRSNTPAVKPQREPQAAAVPSVEQRLTEQVLLAPKALRVATPVQVTLTVLRAVVVVLAALAATSRAPPVAKVVRVFLATSLAQR